MIPLVMNTKEFKKMKKIIVSTIEKLEKELNYEFNYLIGTMIELPSAALNSSAIGLSLIHISEPTRL